MLRVLSVLYLIALGSSLQFQDEPLADEEVKSNEADALEREFDELVQKDFEPSLNLISGWLSETKHGKLVQSAIADKCKMDIRKDAYLHEECADPWIKTKQCAKPYEITNYRLGDLFFEPWGNLGNVASKNAFRTKFYFPKSVGAQYLKVKKHGRDYAALDQVLESDEYKTFERPASDTVIVHLRGFDALTDQQNNFGWYQKSLSFYKKAAQKASDQGFKKAIIVTGDHRITQVAEFSKSEGSKKKAEKAIAATTSKLNEIKGIFEEKGLAVDKRVNYNADCDFVFMVNAKAFVPSGGEFDALIEHMVRRRKGEVFGHSSAY